MLLPLERTLSRGDPTCFFRNCFVSSTCLVLQHSHYMVVYSTHHAVHHIGEPSVDIFAAGTCICLLSHEHLAERRKHLRLEHLVDELFGRVGHDVHVLGVAERNLHARSEHAHRQLPLHRLHQRLLRQCRRRLQPHLRLAQLELRLLHRRLRCGVRVAQVLAALLELRNLLRHPRLVVLRVFVLGVAQLCQILGVLCYHIIAILRTCSQGVYLGHQFC
mmetsp:Transcript_47238/g.90170  ORF Transcript_47238/g.90170 Transcript_47238/m.90170 type:complete len:218 (-) Transcript_47238:213-866(-)